LLIWRNMTPILEIQSVSKKFNIHHEGGSYLSLRDKITEFVKFKSSQKSDEEFWALKDVSFNVMPGESIGIIGKNGAGKSTLLKILSKITPPTQGKIISRGRIASLLEVGTGFHPELTGRENVYLNGSILGMRKKEIDARFDEIVDFAGTEKFLDTPLKHYSSGMQLRLAFAVAAFLEPEILVIDEVLAVGDAEFQKKCIGKMAEVGKSGRTILFVSHNMTALQSLCPTSIWLENGMLRKEGRSLELIQEYSSTFTKTTNIKLLTEKDMWLTSFITQKEGSLTSLTSLENGEFIINIHSKIETHDVFIGVGVNDAAGSRIFTLFSKFSSRKYKISKGANSFVCVAKSLPIKTGNYFAEVYVGDGLGTTHVYYNYGLSFDVLSPEKSNHLATPDDSQGSFIVEQLWN
jgi:lipopolysaccharide transport system ATP-binding protein